MCCIVNCCEQLSAYNVTPCLKIAISWKPAASLLTSLPEATATTSSNSLLPTVSRSSPSATTPALKSIQLSFLPASLELLEIFMVGTGHAKGVPRPVVNNTICAPLAASAVAATRSLPGALSRLSPGVDTVSPYARTPFTIALPDFCVQPRDLSSNVEIPPFLFPGDGFSYIV